MKKFDDATHLELMMTIPTAFSHFGEDVQHFELAGYLDFHCEPDPSLIFDDFVYGSYNGGKYLIVLKFLGEGRANNNFFIPYDEYLCTIDECADYLYVSSKQLEGTYPIAMFDEFGRWLPPTISDNPEYAKWANNIGNGIRKKWLKKK